MKSSSTLGDNLLSVSTSPARLYNIQGEWATAGADVWIQIIDSANPVSGTTVPLKSYPVGAGSAASPTPFSWAWPTMAPLLLANALFVAFSSTDAVYTEPSGTGNIFVDYDDDLNTVGGLSKVSDTANNKVQLFAAAANVSSRKKPYRVTVAHSYTGGKAFLQLFAADSASDGDKPVYEVPLTYSTNDGSTYIARALDANFGPEGLERFIKTGCYAAVSSTSGSLTLIAHATSEFDIVGFYKGQ